MTQNLHVSKFNNGDDIPNIIEGLNWQKTSIPSWVYYKNDIRYDSIFGKLYNWFSVSDLRKLCPTGWHVPSESDWNYLSEHLGGNSVAGGKMKEVGTTSWNSPNTDATNTSLFSALPGGGRGEPHVHRERHRDASHDADDGIP